MGFFDLFRRKPTPPPIVDMRQPNDWKAGDLAVCLIEHLYWTPGCPDCPAKGEIRRVYSVEDFISEALGIRDYWLRFVGFSCQGWSSRSFRKAEEDREPAAEEFTAFIKRPVREPERVS